MFRSGSILILAAFACLVLTTPDILSAQEAGAEPAVQPGWRVRVTTKGPEGPVTHSVTGNVERLTSDRMFVESGADLFEIPYDDLVALEVSEGQKSNWQKGLLYGVVTGGLVGIIYGVADDDTEIVAAGAIGMAAGGAVGALIGALIKSEHWTSVPLLPQGASLTGYNGGLALVIPTRF